MIRRFPVAALALSSALFGLMAVLVRLTALQGFGTWEVVTWRMGLGALGCAPFLLFGDHTYRVSRPRVLAIRVLIGATAVVTYFWSIALLPVGLASLFNYLGPLFTTVFAAWFLGERPGRMLLVGLAVALGGALLTLRGVAAGSALGAAVGLFSAVCQGGAVTFIRELRRTEGPVTIFFWFAVATALLCLPFALFHCHRPTAPQIWLLMGVGLSSLAAQLIFTSALGHATAATAALLGPLTPVTGFLLGASWLGEPLNSRVALGALLAIAGVALGTLGTGQRAKAEVAATLSEG